jgi:hypothetical protein
MLHELKHLIGSRILATDGRVGTIGTFLFDDQSWLIRYMVVDVGSWLGRQEVIVPVEAIERLNWESRIFRVRLTRRQIQESPPADTHKPVSRQQELAMRAYFGRMACWVDQELGTTSLPTGVLYPVPPTEDPHLRSVGYLLGYEVWGNHGRLGTLQGFAVDEHNWRIGFLDIQGETWLLDQATMVPADWVRCISWADHRIYLQQERDLQRRGA